jgi:hypothetical protein
MRIRCVHGKLVCGQEWGARSPLGSEASAKEADRAEFRDLGAGTRRSGTWRSHIKAALSAAPERGEAAPEVAPIQSRSHTNENGTYPANPLRVQDLLS